MTPPEVMAYRAAGTSPDSPGWEVRVVPNLYPAFGPPTGDLDLHHEGPYLVMNGVGVHEVVVTSTSHSADLADLSVDEIDRTVRAWIDRYRANAGNALVKYLLLIDNHGKEAGASLEHPHAQLFGIPVLPPVIDEEIRGVSRYRQQQGRCVYCDIAETELAVGERIIYQNDRFLVYAPFASRTPFEVQILPRWHTSRFEILDDDERWAFADALRELVRRMQYGLNDPPFNFYIHTAPNGAGSELDYHWHLELVPKLTIAAGFELGSGIMINVTTPESAAEFLRGVDADAMQQQTVAQAVH
jgi:UDPglucose--hexose-1-phosphate uridylyltransferase